MNHETRLVVFWVGFAVLWVVALIVSMQAYRIQKLQAQVEDLKNQRSALESVVRQLTHPEDYPC